MKRIFALAIPMMLANISTPLLGMVDTAILGRLDSAIFIGAVAMGGTLITLLFWMFSFLRMGTTSLTAQLYGANDNNGQSLILFRSILLSFVMALCVIAVHPLVLPFAIDLVSNHSQISPLALEYTAIRIWAAPATLITYCIVGWFIGRQNTYIPLTILLVVNFSNILLDLLFILGLDMQTRGAALATLIAEYIGLFVGLGFIWHSALRIPKPHELIEDLIAFRHLMVVNLNIFIRTFLLLSTFLFFTSQGEHLGEEVLAANAILLSLLAFCAHALDGFAYAAEALVGHAVGDKNRTAFWFAVTRTSWLAFLVALFLSFVLLFGEPWLLPLFTNLEGILSIAYKYYAWLVFLPLLAVGSYQMDGIFIGMGLYKEMRNSMLISSLVIFFPLWFMTQGWGNSGLWFALLFFHVARFTTQLWFFIRSFKISLQDSLLFLRVD